jgi:hypothetical protein
MGTRILGSSRRCFDGVGYLTRTRMGIAGTEQIPSPRPLKSIERSGVFGNHLARTRIGGQEQTKSLRSYRAPVVHFNDDDAQFLRAH